MLRNQLKIFYLPILLLLVTACSNREGSDLEKLHANPTPTTVPTVEVKKTDQGFSLFRNGKPYWIKGAAGTQNLERLKAAGANSIRTYNADGLDTLLDKAQELGLTVMVGIWLEHEIEGFNYQDPEQVENQKKRVEALVNKYKDHPALLCWALGNEVIEYSENPILITRTIDQLVQVIHQLDVNHPVTTVCIGMKTVNLIAKEAKHLDFVSLNAFGKVRQISQEVKSPFLISEWGVSGYWESPTTKWGSPLETNSSDKVKTIEKRYRYIQEIKPGNCLGGYVFYWGQKQEVTHSWFSLFLENGAKTPMADILATLWGGSPVENRSPSISQLVFSPQPARIEVNDALKAVVTVFDPEKDALTFRWEITRDERKIEYVPQKVERRPQPIPDLFIRRSGNELTFRAPSEGGLYRLYVFVYDQFGNGSTANFPFLVENNALSD